MKYRGILAISEISIPPTSGEAPHASDLDDRFFAEGVQSEREALTQRTHAAAHAVEEEEIDPKILLKIFNLLCPRNRNNIFSLRQ